LTAERAVLARARRDLTLNARNAGRRVLEPATGRRHREQRERPDRRRVPHAPSQFHDSTPIRDGWPGPAQWSIPPALTRAL
jgi:hypothetical protein